MNRIIYIIAQGHTGSTLLDCILGTHPDIMSSGEMCYLNYQIERTQNKIASIENQDICTCLHNFSDCSFWKSVSEDLYSKTGINILEKPSSFDRAFFGTYSYKGRGGHKVSKDSKHKRAMARHALFNNCTKDTLLSIEPKIYDWVLNEWALCQSMAKVGNKKLVVDSSKDITKALLMHKFYDGKIALVCIHRDVRGLAASIKRRLKKKKILSFLTIPYTMLAKYKYEKKIKSLERIKGLECINVHYEEFVKYPQRFLIDFSNTLGISTSELFQTDDNFFIEPNKLHIVAGNPMRYYGKRKVTYDNRWISELSKFELLILGLFLKKRF